MATSEWHWELGSKYAVEAIKTSLLLGAAAIALMTFAGTREISPGLIWAMGLFAAGAVASVAAFFAAYKTQLNYGNAEVPGEANKQRLWRMGVRWNSGSMWLVVLSVVMFCIGAFVAAVYIPVTPRAGTKAALAVYGPVLSGTWTDCSS
jgi:hypothetical protein